MTGTFLGTTLEDMSLGSESLASAACSEPDQYCCDDTFGKMIGGLRTLNFKMRFLFKLCPWLDIYRHVRRRMRSQIHFLKSPRS